MKVRLPPNCYHYHKLVILLFIYSIITIMNDPHHRSDAIAALEEYNTEYEDDDDDGSHGHIS